MQIFWPIGRGNAVKTLRYQDDSFPSQIQDGMRLKDRIQCYIPNIPFPWLMQSTGQAFFNQVHPELVVVGPTVWVSGHIFSIATRKDK